MKSEIVFDVDGVVADYEGKLIDQLYREFGKNAWAPRGLYSLEERYKNNPDILERALELTSDPNFYFGVDVIEGSAEFCQRLMDMGYFIQFVSSRPQSAETFTNRWLKKHLVGRGFSVSCGIKDKVVFLKDSFQDIDFVVEDSPFQIESFQKAGFLVLCWDQPWNQRAFPRLYVRRDGEVMLWEEESTEAQPFFVQEAA